MTTTNAKRAGYYALTSGTPGLGLCNFCRFAKWSGYSECGYKYAPEDLDCRHPLWRVSENAYEVWGEGRDCWGFRPLYSLAGAADAVGLMLQAEAAAIEAKKDPERATWGAVDWGSVERVRRSGVKI